MQILIDLSDWLWSNLLGYALIALGVFFAIRLGFPQIRRFGHALRAMKKSLKGSEGGVSGFGTLMAALGGQLGTGSLVGVSSALVAGGPGAVFWMWITALFGMTVSMAETVLGQLYRHKEKNGEYTGGPSYYIEKGLRSRILGVIIAILYVFGIGFSICSLQTNSIANAFTGVVDINPLIPGIIVVILALIVSIGGIKRLTKASSLIVPFMVIFYFIIVVFIIVTHYQNIPSVFATIIDGAFTGRAVVGGIGGWAVAAAFRNGVARGMFSNDAGNGCAAIMHASADVKHPVDQGLLGMVGTFTTTIIVCTLTAMAILMTGAIESGNDGIVLLQTAFNSAVGPVGSWVVFLAMFLFGFTTLLADMHYGEANISYIFKERDRLPIWIYRIVLAVILVISSTIQLTTIWALVDLFLAFIILINIVAMIYLNKQIKFAYDNYFHQVKAGKEPSWDYSLDITRIDLAHPEDPKEL